MKETYLKLAGNFFIVAFSFKLKIYFFPFFQIFQRLERPAEEQRIAHLKEVVRTQREEFISAILNITGEDLDGVLSDHLAKYEKVSSKAAVVLNDNLVENTQRMNFFCTNFAIHVFPMQYTCFFM